VLHGRFRAIFFAITNGGEALVKLFHDRAAVPFSPKDPSQLAQPQRSIPSRPQDAQANSISRSR
jgi:hypothetical protein